MNSQLPTEPEKLARVCRRYRIQRLSLFGSVLNGRAKADSDIDLLVEFEPHGGSAAISEMKSSAKRVCSMSPDDRVRLQHMVDAIDSALRFSSGRIRAAPLREQLKAILAQA